MSSHRGNIATLAPETKMVDYIGYDPKHANDFATDLRVDKASSFDVGPTTEAELESSPTRGKGKLVSLIVLVVATILFVVTISLSGQDCKLSLCQKLDKSSQNGSNHKNITLQFIAPLKFAWAAFAVSILGAAVFALYAFLILNIDGLTSNMTNITLIVQRGVRGFLFREYRLLLILIAVIFSLPAAGKLWATSACFLFGALFSTVLGFVSSSISVRGALTTASVAQDSLHDCLVIALRTGSLVGIATVSLGLGGFAVCYLIFQNVRALLGYALGVSCAALLSRLAGGLYKKAANFGSELIQDMNVDSDDIRNPARIAESVGAVLGNISGMAMDFMSSHVMALSATAILGAYLPYFYDNAYAMCVFSHLDLDRACVAYDTHGKKTSFAASICRFDEFYRGYPGLSVWQSNALFVALPFIIGLVGVVTSAVCTLRFFVPKGTQVPDTCELKSTFLNKTLWRLRLNVIVSTLLTIVSSAVICFVMFGRSSTFQQNFGGFDRYALQPLTESNAASRCRPVEAQVGIGKTGLPDLRLLKSEYRPINTYGNRYPKPAQVPWRLFLCIFLGCVMSLVLAIVTASFQSLVREPAGERVLGLGNSRGNLANEALGMGMVSTILPTAIIIAATSTSSKLFGAYGVGLCALGFLSSVGTLASCNALRPITDNAKAVSQGRFVPIMTWKTVEAGSVIAKAMSATVSGISSGTAAVSSFSLLAVFIQESGLVPSPSQLVGSLTKQPSRHITDVKNVNMLNIYVLVSTLLGVVMPFLFASFVLLSGNHATLIMASEARNFVRNLPDARRVVPDMTGQYAKSMNRSSASSQMNVILPLLLAVMPPLAVGFGFGSKALLGMTVGIISSSTLLSIVFSNAWGALANVKACVLDGYRQMTGDRSEWRDAIRTGEMFGESLMDCCAPSLSAIMKFSTVLAATAASLVSSETRKWWIGLMLLSAGFVIATTISFIARRRRQSETLRYISKNTERDYGRDYSALKLDPTFVSPFYEEGHRVEENQISPTSPFAQLRGTCNGVAFFDDDDHWSPYEAIEKVHTTGRSNSGYEATIATTDAAVEVDPIRVNL